jgi:hypothetical protein
MKLDINVDAASDSDVEMQSACSHLTPLPSATQGEPPDHKRKEEPANDTLKPPNGFNQDDHHMDIEEPVARASFDLLSRIKGMYRLLDLVYEEASGGGGMGKAIIF